jgi:hypothetical protein
MFIGGMAGNLNYYGVPALKAASGGWRVIPRWTLPGSALSGSAWAVRLS